MQFQEEAQVIMQMWTVRYSVCLINQERQETSELNV